MTIQQLKQTLTLPQLLQHYNLVPNKNKLIKCPFHEDKKASLQINEDFYYCHGCAKKGDIIDWVQEFDKCDKKTAIAKCKSFVEIFQVLPNKPITKPIIMKSNENFDKLFDQFNKCLLGNPKAMEYAKNRMLNPEETQIGFNDGKQFDKLKNCLIFPLRNEKGEIVSFYGRSVNETATSKHFYLSDRCGLYPRYPEKNTKKIILTEAVIDAMTLELALHTTNDWNEYNVLALYGVNGLTEQHIQAIKELKNLEEIIFFFDGDKPGEDAILKYCEQLDSSLNKGELAKQTLNFELNNCPDIAQTIAVTCFGLGIGCHLTGLHTLKIKETDRLEALKNELTKLGANISVTNDSLTLEPSEKINENISIKTYQDHRMAMAFAPLALIVPIIIEEAEVISKSYPTFWDDLKSVGFTITSHL